MKKAIVLATLFVLSALLSAQDKRQERPDLKLIADIPMDGGTSRFDYQSINYNNGRLYFAHLGGNAVIAFDLKAQKVVNYVKNIAKPHGVLAVPQLGCVYVSATGDNQVVVIDEESLSVVKRIPVGKYPDGLAYDPENNKVFVSDESGGTVSVINARTNEFIEDIDIGGEIGNTQYDPISKLIYSAAQTRNQLVAIDPKSDKIMARYDLPDCDNPHGFYIDPVTHYALITGEESNKFAVLDLTTKEIIYKDYVGKTPDVLAFDPAFSRLYVSSESGVMTIFEVKKDKIKKIGEGFLASGAHTVSVDKNSHQIYLPLENVDGKPVLRIMMPNLQSQPKMPDTEKIESITGLKGAYNKDEGVFKISWPRTDVKISVDGWSMPPFMGLTSWVGFKNGAKAQTMAMGDLVLFPDEVNQVMSILFDNDIRVTALHNHFFFDDPHVYFMHIDAEGNSETIAAGVRKAMDTVKDIRSKNPNPSKTFSGASIPEKNAITANPLEEIFGAKGLTNNGMVKFVFGRPAKAGCGCSLGKDMGVNTWAAFAGSDDNTIVDGDFAVHEDELQPVMKSLRKSGVNIVAIHHHMIFEEPRIIFFHYWGKGKATDLAQAIKSALAILKD